MALASDSGPPLRPKGLAKEKQRSLPPPDGLSDRKAWPNTTSDSDQRLRPGMHRTPAYNSSPTSAVRADWDQSTGDARSMRTRRQAEQVKQDAQVDRKTKDRTLYTYRTVPIGHVRRVPCNLPGMSEPKQCCGRRHFFLQCYGRHQSPYQANTVRPPTCL